MDLHRAYQQKLKDQNFGLCISPQDLILPSYNYHNIFYYGPWKWYMYTPKDFGLTIQNEKDKFHICLDVQHFKPDEINVKVAGNIVIIEGNHEEREDIHGFISRMFKRKYILPKDCNADSVVSSLSSDGVLIVTADKNIDEKSKEIVVPIKMCQPIRSKTDSKCITKGTVETTKKHAEEVKTAEMEANKSKTALMLREDHCRLLKPGFLGEAAGAAIVKPSIEAKTDMVDLLCKTTEKNTTVSDELEQKIEKCEKSNKKSDTEILQTEGTVAGESITNSDVYSAQSTLRESIEVHQSTSSDELEQEKQKCEKSNKKSGTEILQTEKSVAGASITNSGVYSAQNTLRDSIEVHQSTSSYSSSVKETNEKISEIVSDISAQLKEAAENI